MTVLLRQGERNGRFNTQTERNRVSKLRRRSVTGSATGGRVIDTHYPSCVPAAKASEKLDRVNAFAFLLSSEAFQPSVLSLSSRLPPSVCLDESSLEHVYRSTSRRDSPRTQEQYFWLEQRDSWLGFVVRRQLICEAIGRLALEHPGSLNVKSTFQIFTQVTEAECV